MCSGGAADGAWSCPFSDTEAEDRMDAPGGRNGIAVIGMGNLLMGDDGAGIHALQRLRQECREEGVSWIDGGTDAWGALWQASGHHHLLLLDAVRGGGPPGTVYRLSLAELDARRARLSLHEATLVDLIRLEGVLDRPFASVRVVGMEPAGVEPGVELSRPCREALSELVRAALSEIRQLKTAEKVQGAGLC